MSIAQLNRLGITGTSGNLQRDFAIINANLNRELEKIKHRSNKGLILAAIAIRRDMEVTPPYIPVDYGNMKASWFIVTKKTADPQSKAMQKTVASFKYAKSVKVLQDLKEGHMEVISSAEGKLSKYPIGVLCGFSAYYTAPVHEMVGDVNWSKSGSGAKFFQAALFRNFDNIIYIVKTNAQVRP